MPTTVNGIGTTYYGKRNLKVETGVCQKCNHEVSLSSYDTTLWFVVLLIPIIPLGKKRIINYCPRCTTHRVMPLEEWNRAVDEIVTNTEAEAKAQPTDVSAAIRHNASLLELGRREEARANLPELIARFGNDPEAVFYVGAAYEKLGDAAEADRYFDRAYELNPHHAPARRAKAVGLIQQGRPEEARRLLDFMMNKCEDQDPTVLIMLALAFQNLGEHHSALDVFRVVCRDYPELGPQKKFRKLVLASEKAVNAPMSLLPAKIFPWRKLAVVFTIIAALTLGPYGYGYYLRTHRQLRIYNAYPGPLKVTLDTGREISFANAADIQLVSIPEGRHRAKISGPFVETIDFTLDHHYFSDPNVYFLNPGGLAVLAQEKAFYDARPDQALEPQHTYLAGRRFFALQGIDYLFTEFPETVKIDTRFGQSVSKTRLREVNLPPEQAVTLLIARDDYKLCLDYCENWMALAKRDSLTMYYLHCATEAKAIPRARAFLKTKLADRPLRIEWHRAYQQIAQNEPGSLEKLIAEYDQHLAKDPNNSLLVYLRGRIEPDPAKALAYYAQAVQLDPKDAYADNAMANHYLAVGEFAKAREYSELAVQLQKDNETFQGIYRLTLLATGAFAELEKDLRPRAKISKEFLDLAAVQELVILLVQENRAPEAEKLIAQVEALENAENTGVPLQYSPVLRAALLDAQRDVPGLKALIAGIPDPEVATPLRSKYALELNGPVAAEAVLKTIPDNGNPGLNELLLSLLYARANKPAKTLQWEKRALDLLGQNDPDPSYQVFRDLMAGKLPPSPENLNRLIVTPQVKAVLLTALAVKYPKEKARLFLEADKFNFSLEFPHYLLKSFQK